MQRDDAALGELDEDAANARAADAERFAQHVFSQLRVGVQATIHDRRDDLLDDLVLGRGRAGALRRSDALDLLHWAVLLDHPNLYCSNARRDALQLGAPAQIISRTPAQGIPSPTHINAFGHTPTTQE